MLCPFNRVYTTNTITIRPQHDVWVVYHNIYIISRLYILHIYYSLYMLCPFIIYTIQDIWDILPKPYISETVFPIHTSFS